MLVPLNVDLVVFELLPLSFEFVKFLLVFLPDDPLFLFQSRFELRGFFDCFAANKHLRSEHLYSRL
jgi:hypothetical protein